MAETVNCQTESIVASFIWLPTFCAFHDDCNDYSLKNRMWQLHGVYLNTIGDENTFCRKLESKYPHCPNEKAAYKKHMKENRIMADKSRQFRYERRHGQCIDICFSPHLYKKSFVCQVGKIITDNNIKAMLESAKVVPGAFYDIRNIHNAIKNRTNKNPFIDCYYSDYRSSGYLAFLYQINLCYNHQNFTIIDSDAAAIYRRHIKPNTDVLTNALDLDNYIYYPIDYYDAKSLAEYIEGTEFEDKVGDGSKLLESYRKSRPRSKAKRARLFR